MKSVTCPNCSRVVPPQEVAGGWCEACGKRLPPFAVSGVSRDSRRFLHSAGPASAVKTESTKTSLGGYVTVLGCIVLGALITVAIESGQTRWTWLGCGIGAGAGVAIAQAAGMWPKKPKRA